MSELKIDSENVRKAYEQGCPDVKKVLETLFPGAVNRDYAKAGDITQHSDHIYIYLDEAKVKEALAAQIDGYLLGVRLFEGKYESIRWFSRKFGTTEKRVDLVAK